MSDTNGCDMVVEVGDGAAADQVLFKIGLVADVQYADADDATSFHGALRFYRNSLAGLRRALRAFESERVAAAVNLGDAVDGKMRGCPGGAAAGFDDVMACFQGRPFPSYQMVGNHDLYNLPRSALNKRLGIAPAGPHGASYYSFAPHPSTRVVVLDSYQLSLLDTDQGPEHPLRIQAEQILSVNPNSNKHSPDGLEGEARRFVEFGGGVAADQLQWLAAELAEARAEGQRVIVAGHVPFCPGTCPEPCVLWNYPEVLSILEASGVVVATLAGHAHMNGYVLRNGIHHLVMPSILETPPGRDAYAVLDVTPSALVLRGADTCMSLALRYACAPGAAAPAAPPLPLHALHPWAAAEAAGKAACGGEARREAAAAAAGAAAAEAGARVLSAAVRA